MNKGTLRDLGSGDGSKGLWTGGSPSLFAVEGTIVERFTGVAWTTDISPAAVLGGIWGSGPLNVIVVGVRGTIARFGP